MNGCLQRFFAAIFRGCSLAVGAALLPAPLLADAAESAEAIRVDLQYVEKTFSVSSTTLWNHNFHTIRQPFAKEPALSTKPVHRGRLTGPLGSGNDLALLWLPAEGRLLVDLNRNGDLTDDPKGQYKQVDFNTNQLNTRFGHFEGIGVDFRFQGVKRRALIDLTLHNYGSSLGGTLSWRSYWHGKAALPGGDYETGIIPGAEREGKLLLRPWAQRNESFDAGAEAAATVDLPSKVFVGKQAFELEQRLDQETVSLAFKPMTVPFGELALRGKFLERLVLRDSGQSMTVVLDLPGETNRIPVGTYEQPRAVLRNGKDFAYRQGNRYPNSEPRLRVAKDTLASLTIGGPLTNQVTARRRGGVLVMDYKLVGADGGTYSLASGNQQPPKVSIARSGKVLNTGTFEYG